MLYRIQSISGSILRLKYQIIWLTCRKTEPLSKTLQSYRLFHFNRFLWNVRVDRICNPYYFNFGRSNKNYMVLLGIFHLKLFFCFHVWNSKSFQSSFRPYLHVLFYLSRDIYTNQKIFWMLVKTRNH